MAKRSISRSVVGQFDNALIHLHLSQGLSFPYLLKEMTSIVQGGGLGWASNFSFGDRLKLKDQRDKKKERIEEHLKQTDPFIGLLQH